MVACFAVAFCNMVEAQTSNRLDMGLDNELGMLLNPAYLQTEIQIYCSQFLIFNIVFKKSRHYSVFLDWYVCTNYQDCKTLSRLSFFMGPQLSVCKVTFLIVSWLHRHYLGCDRMLISYNWCCYMQICIIFGVTLMIVSAIGGFRTILRDWSTYKIFGPNPQGF